VLKRRLLSLMAATAFAVPTTLLTTVVSPSASAATAVAQPAVARSSVAEFCYTITNYSSGELSIVGNGVNNPVTLGEIGNCFDQINGFTYQGYTGYEYQNQSGHCLWNNGGTLEMGAACTAGRANEEFFETLYTTDEGWFIGNVADGVTGGAVGSPGCTIGSQVQMVTSARDCIVWNFVEG